MGMFLYSAALEMISINPRIFVLAFRDMLNNSVKHKHKATVTFESEDWPTVRNWQKRFSSVLVQTDGGVVDVVVRSDHAQIERRYIHLILDADALGLLQVM